MCVTMQKFISNFTENSEMTMIGDKYDREMLSKKVAKITKLVKCALMKSSFLILIHPFMELGKTEEKL